LVESEILLAAGERGRYAEPNNTFKFSEIIKYNKDRTSGALLDPRTHLKKMEIQELKALIKESIREVLREERLLLCKSLVPYISNEEQAEIEAEFGSPSDYKAEEFIDMTHWVKYGSQISQRSN
jgi:hypothetical protein